MLGVKGRIYKGADIKLMPQVKHIAIILVLPWYPQKVRLVSCIIHEFPYP